MSNIGSFIKEKRESAGLSLEKLGKACGLSDSEIHKIESGKRERPNWDNLCRIAKALKIHPFYLMLEAGYISEKDIHPNIKIQNLERLSDADIRTVQLFIDFLISRKPACVNDSDKRRTSFRLGELFCGPGGLAWGAIHASIENSEFKIVHQWANDFDESTCQTYTHNICPENPESVYCEDVHTLDLQKLGEIDALAFGFPCNDFSMVGEKRGFKGKYGPLYSYGIEVLKLYHPMWFLAENVGGLRSANEGKAYDKILSDMKAAGYRVYPNLYKFEEYGIPQARHRIIIIGIRNDLPYEFKVPAPSGIIKTCKQAIEEPPIPSDAFNNESTNQSALVVKRLNLIGPGQNIWDVNLPDDLKIHTKTQISTIYKRLDPDKPSYTVTGSGGGGTHIYHWKEPRALTNRERARLQTFPDEYFFYGSKEQVRKQIGMAVPCEGAKLIFEAVLKTFAGIEYDSVDPNITDEE